MTKDVTHGPRGHHTVTPYMIIRNAADAIAFYKRAFNARELMCLTSEKGAVQHAEIEIGNSTNMVVDEFPEFPIMHGPETMGGATMHIFLYVDDVDVLFAQAINAGAKELEPVKNHVEGDRRGGMVDPFGHIWWIATHIKDVPMEDL